MTLAEKAHASYQEGSRLVAPLMGFPGLQLRGGSIKLAQQNYGEHFGTVRALAERFRPDLIFPLMDLSVEANAFGCYTLFPVHKAATVVEEGFDISDIERWRRVNMTFDTRLQGYVETQKLMNIGLPEGMLCGGYVSGPYTLAAMLMGSDNAAMATVLEPETLHSLCSFATEKIQEYTRLLISAGAQVIGVLEPSAVMLGPEAFQSFSAEYIKHIRRSVDYTGVNIVYHTCGNTMHLLESMVDAGVHGVSLDAPEAGVDLPEAARRTPEDVAVIGNIHPAMTMVRGRSEDVREETDELLRAMDPYPHFILSTGCDLPEETPLENIQAFMDAGRQHRIKG